MKKNKIALVTGANRGLGFETCLQLAQLGLTVILSARDLIKGQVAAKQLADKGLDVLFYQLDVSNQSNISILVSATDICATNGGADLPAAAAAVRNVGI